MAISGVDQSVSAMTMSQMMPPKPPKEDASGMASNIIDELDTNGDGVLSAEEISAGGEKAERILGADTDGDGSVTEDELLADISAKMQEMPEMPEMPEGEDFDINQLKTMIAQMQTDETYESGSELIEQILDQMGVAEEDSSTILDMVKTSSVNVMT